MVRITIGIYVLGLLWIRLKAAASPAQGRRQHAILLGFLVAYAIDTLMLPGISSPTPVQYVFYVLYATLLASFCASDAFSGCQFDAMDVAQVCVVAFHLAGIAAVWRLTRHWHGLLGYAAGYAAGALLNVLPFLLYLAFSLLSGLFAPPAGT
jgi:hypothetical protein